MAKGAYIGVSSKARKIKNIYIGVNGVARKVKKAYIGVNGVAHLFFTSKAEAPNMQNGRCDFQAVTFANRAVFGLGGYYDETATTELVMTKTVDLYDANLTKTVAGAASIGRYQLGAARAGNSYLYFAGGVDPTYSWTYYSTVDKYNSSFTRSSASSLTYTSYGCCGSTAGNYAVFLYSTDGNGTRGNYYDTNGTRGSLSANTSQGMQGLENSSRGAVFGNYAVFAGGGDIQSSVNIVSVYNSSLTRSTYYLSVARKGAGHAANSTYCVIAGGERTIDLSNSSWLNSVEAFNTSFTRTSATALPYTAGIVAGSNTTSNKYVVFAGGTGDLNPSFKQVVSYNTSLTRNIAEPMEHDRTRHSATHIGKYVLIGGGVRELDHQTIDVWEEP